ncbi:unnamed protein product, partial [Rotaria socialis]
MGLRDFFRKYKNRNEIPSCSTINKKSQIPQQQQTPKSRYIKSIDLNSRVPENISEKYRQFPFPTRRNAITDEYEVSEESLGIGINGKVLTCWQRVTKRKCALKIIKDSDKARREI